jgi:hypothetical protein
VFLSSSADIHLQFSFFASVSLTQFILASKCKSKKDIPLGISQEE